MYYSYYNRDYEDKEEEEKVLNPKCILNYMNKGSVYNDLEYFEAEI